MPYIQLPNKEWARVPDGLTDEQAFALARERAPEAFMSPEELDSKRGFFPALSAGLHGGLGETAQGIGALVGSDALRKYGESEQKKAQAAFMPTEKADSVGSAISKYLTEPVGGIIGRYGPPVVAGMALPFLAPEAAATGIGTALAGAGARAMAPEAIAALGARTIAGAGTMAADLPAEIGANVQRQAEQKQPENIVSATAFGLLQAALAAFGVPGLGALSKGARATLGRSATEQAKDVLVGKLTKEEAIARLSSTAKNILTETGVNAVGGMGMMVGTEAARRAAAGQDVTGTEATEEYKRNILGALELAPIFGIAHGAFKRGKEEKTITKAADKFETKKGEQERIADEVERVRQRADPTYVEPRMAQIAELEKQKEEYTKWGKANPEKKAGAKALKKEAEEKIKAIQLELGITPEVKQEKSTEQARAEFEADQAAAANAPPKSEVEKAEKLKEYADGQAQALTKQEEARKEITDYEELLKLGTLDPAETKKVKNQLRTLNAKFSDAEELHAQLQDKIDLLQTGETKTQRNTRVKQEEKDALTKAAFERYWAQQEQKDESQHDTELAKFILADKERQRVEAETAMSKLEENQQDREDRRAFRRQYVVGKGEIEGKKVIAPAFVSPPTEEYGTKPLPAEELAKQQEAQAKQLEEHRTDYETWRAEQQTKGEDLTNLSTAEAQFLNKTVPELQAAIYVPPEVTGHIARTQADTQRQTAEEHLSEALDTIVHLRTGEFKGGAKGRFPTDKLAALMQKAWEAVKNYSETSLHEAALRRAAAGAEKSIDTIKSEANEKFKERQTSDGKIIKPDLIAKDAWIREQLAIQDLNKRAAGRNELTVAEAQVFHNAVRARFEPLIRKAVRSVKTPSGSAISEAFVKADEVRRNRLKRRMDEHIANAKKLEEAGQKKEARVALGMAQEIEAQLNPAEGKITHGMNRQERRNIAGYLAGHLDRLIAPERETRAVSGKRWIYPTGGERPKKETKQVISSALSEVPYERTEKAQPGEVGPGETPTRGLISKAALEAPPARVVVTRYAKEATTPLSEKALEKQKKIVGVIRNRIINKIREQIDALVMHIETNLLFGKHDINAAKDFKTMMEQWKNDRNIMIESPHGRTTDQLKSLALPPYEKGLTKEFDKETGLWVYYPTRQRVYGTGQIPTHEGIDVFESAAEARAAINLENRARDQLDLEKTYDEFKGLSRGLENVMKHYREATPAEIKKAQAKANAMHNQLLKEEAKIEAEIAKASADIQEFRAKMEEHHKIPKKAGEIVAGSLRATGRVTKVEHTLTRGGDTNLSRVVSDMKKDEADLREKAKSLTGTEKAAATREANRLKDRIAGLSTTSDKVAELQAEGEQILEASRKLKGDEKKAVATRAKALFDQARLLEADTGLRDLHTEVRQIHEEMQEVLPDVINARKRELQALRDGNSPPSVIMEAEERVDDLYARVLNKTKLKAMKAEPAKAGHEGEIAAEAKYHALEKRRGEIEGRFATGIKRRYSKKDAPKSKGHDKDSLLWRAERARDVEDRIAYLNNEITKEIKVARRRAYVQRVNSLESFIAKAEPYVKTKGGDELVKADMARRLKEAKAELEMLKNEPFKKERKGEPDVLREFFIATERYQELNRQLAALQREREEKIPTKLQRIETITEAPVDDVSRAEQAAIKESLIKAGATEEEIQYAMELGESEFTKQKRASAAELAFSGVQRGKSTQFRKVDALISALKAARENVRERIKRRPTDAAAKKAIEEAKEKDKDLGTSLNSLQEQWNTLFTWLTSNGINPKQHIAPSKMHAKLAELQTQINIEKNPKILKSLLNKQKRLFKTLQLAAEPQLKPQKRGRIQGAKARKVGVGAQALERGIAKIRESFDARIDPLHAQWNELDLRERNIKRDRKGMNQPTYGTRELEKIALEKDLIESRVELEQMDEQQAIADISAQHEYNVIELKEKEKLEARVEDADIERAPTAQVRERREIPEDDAAFIRGTEAIGDRRTLTEAEVQSTIDAVKSRWKNAPKIEVLSDISKAPERVREQEAAARAENPDVEPPAAFFYGGKVYVLASGHVTPGGVVRSLFHETLGHYGLRGVFGKELDPILRQVDALRKAEVDAKIKEYGLDPNKPEDRLGAAEEVLTFMAEKHPTLGIVKRFVAFVRGYLRKLGLVHALTDNDIIANYIMPARRFVERGSRAEPVGGELAFKRRDKDSKMEKITDKLVYKDPPLIERVRSTIGGFGNYFSDKNSEFAKVVSLMTDKVKALQMMYDLQMFERLLPITNDTLEHGTYLRSEKTTNGKKEWVYERSGKVGATAIFTEVSKETKFGDAEKTASAFTTYIAAERAAALDEKFGAGAGLAKLDFGKEVTQQELDYALQQGRASPHFQKAREMYREYNRGLIDFAVQAGAISEKLGAELNAMKDYIPWYRVKNGDVLLDIDSGHTVHIGNLKSQPYLHELVGGDARIAPLTTSIIQNTALLNDMALRNNASRNAAFTLADLGLAFINEGNGPAGRNVMHFKLDGKNMYAIVDVGRGPKNLRLEAIKSKIDKLPEGSEELARTKREYARMEQQLKRFEDVNPELLLKGIEGISTSMPAWLKAMAVPSRILRRAVTGNPVYVARNIWRDSWSAWKLTGTDMIPVVDSVKEMVSIVKGTNETEARMKALGMLGGQAFKGDMADALKVMEREIKGGAGFWDKLLMFSDYAAMKSDAATRAALFKDFQKKGMSELETIMAVNNSMNYYKRGSSATVHQLSTMIPFMNAQIRAIDVLVKAFKGDAPLQDKLDVQRKLMQRGLMLSAATMAYAAMMQNNPYYQNASVEARAMNWFFPWPFSEEPLRVPVEFEVGYIFKSLPEMMVNKMTGTADGKEIAKGLYALAIQTVPGATNAFMPTALSFGPIIMNYDTFTGKPVEGRGAQDLLPGYRERTGTTDMAKVLGHATNISPTKIDATVSKYTAQLGMAIMTLASAFVPSGAVPSRAGEVEKTASQIPLIGGIFQRMFGGGPAEYAYDILSRLQQTSRTYDSLINRGDIAGAQALVDKFGVDVANGKVAASITRELGQLNRYEQIIRNIDGSRMSPEAKKKAIENVNKARYKVYRAVVGNQQLNP